MLQIKMVGNKQNKLEKIKTTLKAEICCTTFNGFVFVILDRIQM